MSMCIGLYRAHSSAAASLQARACWRAGLHISCMQQLALARHNRRHAHSARQHGVSSSCCWCPTSRRIQTPRAGLHARRRCASTQLCPAWAAWSRSARPAWTCSAPARSRLGQARCSTHYLASGVVGGGGPAEGDVEVLCLTSGWQDVPCHVRSCGAKGMWSRGPIPHIRGAACTLTWQGFWGGGKSCSCPIACLRHMLHGSRRVCMLLCTCMFAMALQGAGPSVGQPADAWTAFRGPCGMWAAPSGTLQMQTSMNGSRCCPAIHVRCALHIVGAQALTMTVGRPAAV